MELWIVDPEKNILEIFENQNGKMVKNKDYKFSTDEIKSRIFPEIGFKLEIDDA